MRVDARSPLVVLALSMLGAGPVWTQEAAPADSVAPFVRRVEQILLNLLTNAREAMAHGGRITIEARSVEHGVGLAVSDSGCGIPAEHLPQVTEPFFTTKFAGRGLGLSAVLGIVRSHHGAIQVVSEAGRGTRVRVVFPAL